MLEVHARDSGVPVLSSSVMVNIEISDANDNPPLFSQANYTAIVQVSNFRCTVCITNVVINF